VRTIGLLALELTGANDVRGGNQSSLLPLSKAPQHVAAFCAIGNPRAFFSQLQADGLTLNYTRAFPDHHAYTQRDIESLEHEAQAHGAEALLTTAKDAVKLHALKFQLPCYVIEIELEFDDEAAFRQLILQAIGAWGG
jgi:tetraacyldisaccharide 4'-kinase